MIALVIATFMIYSSLASIKNNWVVISTQKEIEMNQIYYSRKIEDEAIKAMVDSLPFTEIKK